MDPVSHIVERHYGHAGIVDSILSALKQHGKNIDNLQPDDLAPVDEFHIRGREGTVELSERIKWKPDMRVLDVGCGIGGSSRFLAHTHGCNVTGIDLTPEYIDSAEILSHLVGLNGSVKYRHASALALPFEDSSFDIAWTQHVQMNIKDKRQFYSEMARVLKPGGQLVFHDIFRSGGREPYYPEPWANDPSYSFLTTPESARSIVEGLGLKILQWEDTTDKSLQWMIQMAENARQANGPMLSPIVIIGESGRVKMENVRRSLAEGILRIVQAVAVK